MEDKFKKIELICANCGDKYNKLPENSEMSWLLVLFIDALVIGSFLFVDVKFGLGVLIFTVVSFACRKSHAINKCPKCQAENVLVPIDTPKGQKLVEEFYGEEG